MDPETFEISGESLRFIGANDLLWKDLEPDDSKAYVGFRICKSLPSIAGPEAHGRYFGQHPQVIANSHRSLLHQQTNLGHLLKAYGATRDRIVGTVIGVAFPQKPGRGWEIPETEEEAPMMEVVAVLHKAAEGVSRLLGDHQSNRKPQSVSIEADGASETMVYDPLDRSFCAMAEVPEKFGDKVLYRHKEKGWQLGKVEGRQLAFAPGGTNGTVSYQGVGYTPNPAESAAHLTEIRAELESGMFIAAMARPEWEPGMGVVWTPLLAGRDAGRGEVIEVITEGEHRVSGRLMTADSVHPLLRIRVHGKKLEVVRSTAFLKKIDEKN